MWRCLLGGNAERADKRTTKGVRRKLHGCGCEREVYTKGTALAGKAVYGHPTTMCMGDMLDDRQAKAGSTKFPGARFVHAVEPLENPVQVPGLPRSWNNGPGRPSSQDELPHVRQRNLQIDPSPHSLVLCRLVKKAVHNSRQRAVSHAGRGI